MKNILIIGFLTLPLICLADDFSYECEINGEYIFGEKGNLISDEKIYSGQKFNVDRKSGVVLGGGVGNSSYPAKEVLDPGGKEQSYKLIWISKDVVGTGGGKNVVYLSVEEFAEGLEKPFVLVAGSRTLSGLCK